MQPFFTICIPVYNREKLITRTLTSIIEQRFEDYEIIIVDDGSTDRSIDIIETFIKKNPTINIKLETKKNGGKHTALNVGIKKAEGKFFIILDSDDYLAKDALISAYNLIEKYNQQYGIIGKSAYQDSKIIGEQFNKDIKFMDYIDFHFGKGFTIRGNRFGDCFECNKTGLLKKYEFPEDPRTKFVPESYIFDRIGLEDRLLCTNSVFLIKEYQIDGITNNYGDFIKKNYIGFLYKYVDELENIFVQRRVGVLPKIYSWSKYWNLKKINTQDENPTVKKITFLGAIVKFSLPIILFIKKYVKHNNDKLDIQ